MRNLLLVATLSVLLMGCEVMDDLAWSDNTYLVDSKAQDGWYWEHYQTDTYGNFSGEHSGIRYDYYVTNNRSKSLCFRLIFSFVRADGYQYGDIYRVEPGERSWLAYASIFSTTGGKTIRVDSTNQWAWIESWETCENNVTW
jgi:hypothetical protein